MQAIIECDDSTAESSKTESSSLSSLDTMDGRGGIWMAEKSIALSSRFSSMFIGVIGVYEQFFLKPLVVTSVIIFNLLMFVEAKELKVRTIVSNKNLTTLVPTRGIEILL